jgi:hypothetical protein
VERFGIYLGGIILKACMYSLTSTWLSSLSYPLSATVTEIGRISDALMSRGWKSIISCLVVGARLILMMHIN